MKPTTNNQQPTTIKLTCRRHPVDPSAMATHSIQYRRQRVSTLVERYMADFSAVNVWVDSNLLSADQVMTMRLKGGEYVLMAPALKDPISAAIWTFATWIAPYAATAAIGMAISYGIQALTVKKPGELPPQPGVKPQYSWSEGTTARPGIPMPLCFGRVPLAGNIISSYTTYNADEDEIRYMLVSFGWGNFEGPVADTLLINGQPAAAYSAVTTDVRYGTVDQTVCTGFDPHINEYRFARPITYDGGAVTFTTPSADFDDLAFLLEYQTRYVTHAGEYRIHNLGIKIEISEHNAGSWFTLVAENKTGGTDAVRRVRYITSGTYTGGSPVTIDYGTRYDVRITKTSADIDPEDTYASRYLNSLAFVYLQEIQDVGFTYPGQPLLAISAVASDEISGSIDIQQVWDTQIINKVDTTVAYSNKPGDILHFLVTLPLITGSGTGPDPYVVDSYNGQDPSTIPGYAAWLSELGDLNTRADETVSTAEGGTVARYQFNGVFAEGTDQWAAIQAVCNACDCVMRPKGNGYKLHIHQNWTTDPVGLYSAGNIIEGSYVEEEIPAIDKKAKFEMEILDSGADYEAAMVPLYESGAGHSAKTETLDGLGYTNRTQAARKLKRCANYNVGVTKRCSFSAALDALCCEELDVIYVIPPEMEGGRVAAYTAGATVTLDKAPVQSAADTLVLRTHNAITGYDHVQALTVLSVAAPNADGSCDVTLTATPTVAPVADQTVYGYGPAADMVQKWRVVSITQKHDDAQGMVHEIACENDYATDPADAWDPEITYSFFSPQTAVKVNGIPKFKDIRAITPVTTFVPFYDVPIAVNRTIVGDGVDTVTWSATDGATPIYQTYRGTTSEITPGSTTLKYVYWDPGSPTVYSDTDDLATATAGDNYIIAINEVGDMYLYDSSALAAVTQHEAAFNFNERNDRDDTAITEPTIIGDGTALVHYANDDGSCNIVFKWQWSGSEPDIDGFQVITYQSTSPASYTIGTATDSERTYTFPADQRAMTLYGVPVNQYITFGVKAYRIVDPDINANGIIETSVIQSARVDEDPFHPADEVGGSFTNPLIISPTIKTAATGKRLEITSDKVAFVTAQTTVGIVGETGDGGSNIVVGETGDGGDNVVVGTGVLMYLYNQSNNVPIDIQLEQTVADIHLPNRASDPSGAARIGDLAVVDGKLVLCTSAGTPGTFTIVGAQTA